MSKLDDEARIRERAYRLWEEEGRRRVAMLNSGNGLKSWSAKGIPIPVAEPHDHG
jgi:hypothetical protein